MLRSKKNFYLSLILLCLTVSNVRAAQEQGLTIDTIEVIGDWTWDRESSEEASSHVREHPIVYAKVYAVAEALKRDAQLLEWEISSVEVNSINESYRARAIVNAKIRYTSVPESSNDNAVQSKDENRGDLVDLSVAEINDLLLLEIADTQSKLDVLIDVITKIGSKGIASGIWKGGKRAADYISQLSLLKERIADFSSNLNRHIATPQSQLVATIVSLDTELRAIDKRIVENYSVSWYSRLLGRNNEVSFADAARELAVSANKLSGTARSLQQKISLQNLEEYAKNSDLTSSDDTANDTTSGNHRLAAGNAGSSSVLGDNYPGRSKVDYSSNVGSKTFLLAALAGNSELSDLDSVVKASINFSPEQREMKSKELLSSAKNYKLGLLKNSFDEVKLFSYVDEKFRRDVGDSTINPEWNRWRETGERYGEPTKYCADFTIPVMWQLPILVSDRWRIMDELNGRSMRSKYYLTKNYAAKDNVLLDSTCNSRKIETASYQMKQVSDKQLYIDIIKDGPSRKFLYLDSNEIAVLLSQ